MSDLKAKPEERTTVAAREPKHCPMCGNGTSLFFAVEWSARSLDPSDPNNTGVLLEYQCMDCAISFWV